MADKELSVRLTADTGSFERKMSTAADKVEALEKRLSRIVTQQELMQKSMSRAKQAGTPSILVPNHIKETLNQELEAQRKIAAEQQRNAAQQKAMDDMIARNALADLEERTAALRRYGAELQKEKIRQQSLNTLGEGDRAAQRLRAEAERTKRAEYERWWLEQDITGELLKQKGFFGRLAYKARNVGLAIKNWATNAYQALNAFRSSHTVFGGIWQYVKQIAGTLLGIQTVRIAIQGADTLVGAQNKLNNIAVQTMGDSAYATDSKGNVTGYSQKALDFTQDAMDKIYVSAQRSRSSYDEMAKNVSKVMTLSGKAFDNNVDNAIRFQETMAKAYAVGGATASEMSASMTQLTQALGAGILAGDELRSVREGAPLAYKAIEEFAQGVLDTDLSLKELASDGFITSEMVVAAIMNMSDSIDKQFALTKWRFSEVWESIKNSAKKAFEPVITMMTNMLNRAVDSGLVQKAEQFFTKVAKGLLIVMRVIENTIKWVADNWNWLKWVILGGLIALITVQIAFGVVSAVVWWQQTKAALIAAGAVNVTFWSFVKLIAGILVVVLAIAALITIFIAWRNGAIETTQAIGLALLAVAVIIGVIIGWIPALIIAAIGLIIMYLDYFLGAVYVVGAAIWNIVVGVVNAIIQFMWTYFVEPWIGIVEWVLNVFNGGFNSFGDAVKNLLGNIISWFLSLGTVVTKIIDAIFGTNWTGGLNALKDKVLQWGKNENAISLTREAPNVLNRVEYGAAWDKGMEHGSIAQDWVNGLGSKFQKQESTVKKPSMLDQIGGKLGLTDTFANMGKFPTEGVGTPDVDTQKILDSIDGNTGKIADSMELTDEDLDYLRRIADMEWKKEYTVAEIKVDMTNNNTVDKDFDLHSLAIGLRDLVEEEMFAVADGVYA